MPFIIYFYLFFKNLLPIYTLKTKILNKYKMTKMIPIKIKIIPKIIKVKGNLLSRTEKDFILLFLLYLYSESNKLAGSFFQFHLIQQIYLHYFYHNSLKFLTNLKLK